MHELSMRDLFPACVTVLNDALLPLHYADLTERAIRRIGLTPRLVNMAKEKENVREKLLLAGQMGTFYSGPPAYAGGLRHWFVSDRQINMTMDEIVIPGDASAGADGAFDALMRAPFMVVHNANLTHTEMLNRSRSHGLVLEKHIARWFQRNYPAFYKPADNEGKWRQPCAHDFKLIVNDRVFCIDVAGPDRHGKFGKRGKKAATDIHLTCQIDRQQCVWSGVVRGEHYRHDIDPRAIFSPTAFLVWLNCAKHGVPYADIEPRADQRRAA